MIMNDAVDCTDIEIGYQIIKFSATIVRR